MSVAAIDPNDLVKEVDNATALTTSITTTSADPNFNQVSLKVRTVNPDAAALVGSTGDETNIASVAATAYTGVYGWAPTAASDTAFGSGVWGDSDDVGTYGLGYVGVRGDGVLGVVGAGDVGGVGVRAWGGNGSGSDIALQVYGKVQFSRAGRATIGAGKSGIKVNMVGVSASSRVFAVLHSNRAGRFVRAVVPTTGSFTIYLNTTVTSSTYVAFFVIN
jgi:hypothetical protein